MEYALAQDDFVSISLIATAIMLLLLYSFLLKETELLEVENFFIFAP